MWRLVLTVVLWNTVLPQPVTDDPQHSRAARELGVIECCPCPGSGRTGQQDLAVAREAAVDDCPCRLRDPDSHGAASDFLPRAERPHRPFLTHDAPKDDVKPLLKPEVGLASSMLETLREVTDEEYQDALARDAARNAARVAELGDTQPDTAKNIVTIIVNPGGDNARDATPEASQPSESRCVQPSGQVRETEKASVFKLQPNLFGRNLLDMDNGASNVQENSVGLNKVLEGLKLKTTPSVLKLFPPRKAQGGNIQSLLKIKDNKQPKNTEIIPTKKFGVLEPRLPKLKLPMKPLSLDLNKLKISKTGPSLARKRFNDSGNDDNNPSTSIIQEQFVPKEKTNIPTFDFKSLLPATNSNNAVFNLKNLLNLKDVELIPPKSPKITLPGLNLFPPLRINKPKTLNNQRKIERLSNNCDTVTKETDEESGEQRVHTEILDAIPHASEFNPEVSVSDIEDPAIINDKNTNQRDENIETQILDALPSASENNDMTIASENRKETQSGIAEDGNNFNGDLEPQIFEDSVTNEFLKDNIENFDSNDNSVEFFINNNSNNQIDALDIVQDNSQSLNEIEISGSSFDTGVEGLDFEIDEDAANFAPPSHTFIEDDDSAPANIDEQNQEPIGFEFEPMQDSQEFENFEIAPVQETGDITDINRDDLFRQLSLDLDGVAETSNQNIQIVSGEFEERNALPKTDIERDELKENDERELELVFDSNTFENFDESLKSSLNSDESLEVEPLTEDTTKYLVDEKSAEIFNNNPNDVNMQDLQQMSDLLLKNSEKRIHSDVCNCGNLERKATIADTGVNNSKAFGSKTETKFTNKNNNEKINYPDTGSSATYLIESYESSNNGNENNRPSNKKLKNMDNSRADLPDGALNQAIINNTCPSNIQSDELLSQSASNFPRNNEMEMASAASESVFKTYPQKSSIISPSSPLLHQSIVVQPSSLFPPIAPLDLSTVTLPTLDDIRLGISNLLGANARAAEDEQIESMEDCPDLNPAMSSDASTTNTKSALPAFRPLEDINLDIFQIGPLSQTPLSSKMPSLNLNSFRTKLALPKRLGLKPMKLQSSLGAKNGGLLGATLTFGPDKNSSFRRKNPITNLGSILDHQGSDILGSPLTNMPSFEELRSKLRANTETLLKSSLVSPLDDTLRTTEALGNSLRSHTENTMRNIQQTLSSTLNEARVNKAGEKFAKPQDLLEMVSSAHEDVKDKLHGIHVDLQDRLTSIHDNILDRSKFQIPTLQTPFLNKLGRLQDSSSSFSKARSEFKKTPSPKLIVRKKKPTARVNKPMTKSKEQNKIKPFKMSKAASSLTPKTVEVPKLMATSSKPPFLRPLQRDESVKLKTPSPIFSNDQRQTSSKNKLKPFGVQSKIAISTTPQPAASFRRSQFQEKSVANRNQQSIPLGNQRMGRIKAFSDSRGFASEPQSMKVPAPVESIASTDFSINSDEKHNKLRENSLQSSLGSLPEFSLSNPLKPRTSLPTLKPIASPIKLMSSPLSLPKPTESPLVSKMRDAIRIRFSRPVKTPEKLNTGLGKPQGKEEMAKSASETRGVAIKTGPMKENIPYKCKMVCVRD